MDKKQQLLLEQFFKEFTTWCPEHVGYHIIAIVLVCITMIMWIMPAQLYEGDYSILLNILGMELMALLLYQQEFAVYMEKGKERRIGEVLRYLPVSRLQLFWFKCKKLFRICAWMTGIALFCQITLSVSFLHGLIWENFAMPLVCNMLIPMVLLTAVTALQSFFYKNM